MASEAAGQKQSVSNKPLDLDDVLVNELGQFGRYQMRNLLLLFLPMTASGFMTEYVFTAASIPHRCRVTECGENYSSNAFHPDWILNAIPATNSSSGIASCSRFEAVGNGTLDSCPANIFTTTTTDCNGEFVYAKDNTVVYDFNLGCQEWLRVLAGTLNGLGTLLVLPVTGYISDTFGRKLALIINIFDIGLFGVIRVYSTNYPMFLALELLQTTLGAGAFSTANVLGTEMVGPRYRVLVSAIAGSGFSTGHVILGGLAWLIPSWRYLTATLFAPCFLMMVYYWILEDSVRWQLSKQKYAEARKTLQKVANVNKKQISEKSMDALCNPPTKQKNFVEIKESNVIAAICRSPVLLRRVVTTPFWWLTTIFVYYGLSINATSLSETMHLNFMLTAAIEIPSAFSAVILLDRIGRKPTLCGGFIFTATCNISFIFISKDFTTVRLVIYMFGKSGIALVLTSLYLYTSELYPTEYRHSLLAFSSMIGRLGAVIAPLTPALMEYWEGFPSAIFGTMAVLSSLLVLTQPETLGVKMPDTIAEAEAIGNSRST